MSDYLKKPKPQADDAFYSRAQAAYALVVLGNAEPSSAANSVIDAFDDNGLDAIFIDKEEKTIYLVQSKWHKDGKGTIEQGDALKFVQGVRDLLEGNFSRFNSRVEREKSSILGALEDPDVRVHLVVVHTGIQELSPHTKRPIQDCLNELNDTSNFASLSILSQKELHQAIRASADGSKITLEVMLHDWGHCKQPYDAYYGQMDASDIGECWRQHGQLLFAKNLRKFTGSTEVNEAIKETLRTEPTKFWYLNNGITILCTSLRKKPMGGGRRNSGVFVCEGISVVNGAQTVGCIGEVYKSFGTISDARVSVRLISLAKCGEAFGLEVTRAANTQNRIERRDFAALDPEQERLRQELQLDLSMAYWYKSGETHGSPDEGCSIEEATVGLACAQPDVALAVQAKREVGRLWEDITKPPYKLLFNSGLTALKMWRVVEIMRCVDGVLKKEQERRSGRGRMVAVHGNRVVLHQVFRVIEVGSLDGPDQEFASVTDRAAYAAKSVLDALIHHVEKEYPQAYTNSLFKNAAKCRVLLAKVDATTAAGLPSQKRPVAREKSASSKHRP
jgi:hypothetical protein